MSTPSDRYTSVYLLSGYGFNDYKLKSQKNSSLNFDKDPLVPNARGDSIAAIGDQIILKNPNLGLFVVGTDSHMQRDETTELCPRVQSVQKGNNHDSPKMGNKSNFSKKGNLGSSLGAAVADFNSGNHGLDNLNQGIVGLGNANQLGLVNDISDRVVSSRQPLSSVVGQEMNATSAKFNSDLLTSSPSLMAVDKHKNLVAGPSFAQILNSGYNASNVKGDDQDATNISFIAPELSKPSIKAKELESKVDRGRSLTRKQVYRPITKSPANPEVPVKNAFSILKKNLRAEIQNPGEPLTGKKKIWADDVEENLEVEDQVIRRNNDDETLLNAEDQHNNSTILDVERDLAQGKEQGQPQPLLDHGNEHTNVFSVDDLENKWDLPT
ncbi:hypothetical protein TorRG33x02_276700 [Trema orientale]|uniref:Uncharacterized protein n=1 Tax=Trema orientale TaxID=63057 RepID=A0A2P5CQE6_TREOI|nr:hypothetical protein TorRG33x02_276700 [Trema orientale]